MGETLKLDYYYGIESEQFSFFRVPRLLVKDDRFKGLSSDAKLMYGLMIDRMSMSIKNGWLDEKNRAYIMYTIDDVCEDLGCGKDKAVKVLAELDSNKGLGLIERKRIGLGRPDIIYVKNFATLQDAEEKESTNPVEITEFGKTEDKNAENQNSGVLENRIQEYGKEEDNKDEAQNSRVRKNRIQEYGKTEDSNTENQNTRSLKKRIQEFGESEANYTNNNYIDLNYNNSIYLPREKDVADQMDQSAAYRELIKKNISYDHYMTYGNPSTKELYNELYQLICEVVCMKTDTVKINGQVYPYDMVRNQFLKLDSSHLEYVIDSIDKTTTKISNIKSYMLTALYNAPNTINLYYKQRVQHDMYGGGSHEQSIV